MPMANAIGYMDGLTDGLTDVYDYEALIASAMMTR